MNECSTLVMYFSIYTHNFTLIDMDTATVTARGIDKYLTTAG